MMVLNGSFSVKHVDFMSFLVFEDVISFVFQPGVLQKWVM